MYKTHHSQTPFGSCDVNKVHAVVARSTFPSENVNHMFGPLLEVKVSKMCTPLWREAHFQVKSVKNWGGSDHFLTLRFRKSARHCGAKHIFKSKCTKHTMFGPKKCTPLWREAHLEVKSVKNCRFWGFFGVQMSKKSLTNLTNLTNWTNLTYLTNLTNLTIQTNLTDLNLSN